MSYIKQNFVDGNPLYADELNHIEDGIKALENEVNNMSPEDGYSPTVTVSKSGKVTTIKITDVNGTKTATINDGADGKNGTDGYTPQKNVDYFDGVDGKDGQNGNDGVSATHSWNGTTLTVTSASGTSSADLKGEKGDTGSNGTSVTVKSVTESTADGGSNVVTFSDGKTVTIKNGSKGSTGSKGADGKTPVKGTDYFTDEDKADIVAAVIEAMGSTVVGTVDSDNNIILTGTLADGTYTLKYENEDGTTSEIGTIEIGGPAYTNYIPLSVDADGNIYNGKGYKEGCRLSTGDGITEKAHTTDLTGYIPVANGDIVRLENMPFKRNSNDGYQQMVYLYSALGVYLAHVDTCNDWNAVFDSDGNTIQFTMTYSGVAYMRLSAIDINANSILTINEEIA